MNCCNVSTVLERSNPDRDLPQKSETCIIGDLNQNGLVWIDEKFWVSIKKGMIFNAEESFIITVGISQELPKQSTNGVTAFCLDFPVLFIDGSTPSR
jgi:hypothetical protein